jgi:hypothetical protein
MEFLRGDDEQRGLVSILERIFSDYAEGSGGCSSTTVVGQLF